MKYGLIGKTLKHSFSKEIQSKLLSSDYEICELKENELERFFLKKDFLGINVTIPYKTDVIKYLDNIDEISRKIGAVNTVINKNGKLYGYNTDYFGLKMLIKKNKIEIFDKNVLIFGSGGTSKTAKVLLEDLGAKSVVRLSRTKTDGFDTYDNIQKYYDVSQVVINTTPVGMYPDNFDTITDIGKFSKLEAVFDVIYNPINTNLVLSAKNSGIVADGGITMLVFQALFSARLFSENDIPDRIGYEIINNLIKEKENIVLVGMPSCGKTTVGGLISKKLSKEFADIDMLIEKNYGKSPKLIIEESGEEKFRELETETIKEISKKTGIVIATGGGAVLREENMNALSQNGKIVFIERDFDELISDSNRPLSSTKERLSKVYIERLPLYKKYSEHTVKCMKTPEETAKKVLDVIL